MDAAASARCKAICLTVGVKPSGNPEGSPVLARPDWKAVASLVSSSPLPVVLKGVNTVAEVRAVLQQDLKGLIISNYGGAPSKVTGPLILQLPELLDVVAGIPVLVDGGFRRGTDIVKALAFGAQAVVVARPVMWGLAAYGAEGVRGVVEMLQTETARYMAMCGKPRLDMLQRDLLRVHAAAPATAASR